MRKLAIVLNYVSLVTIILACIMSRFSGMNVMYLVLGAAVLATPIVSLCFLNSAFQGKGAWLRTKYQRRRLEEQQRIEALKNPAPAD